MNLFGKKTEISKSGVYSINGKNLSPINDLPKTGSYNDISESLGFPESHIVFTFDSKKIQYIAFKTHTKEPIFVSVKDESQSLFYSDIKEMIKEIDWDFEWRQLDFEVNDK